MKKSNQLFESSALDGINSFVRLEDYLALVPYRRHALVLSIKQALR
jgi:hypothetical protein